MLGFSQRWGPCPNFLHFYCLAETYGKRPVLHEYLAESGRLSCLMFCTLSRAAAVCHFLTVETQCIIWNTDMKRRPWTKKPFVCVFGRCPWSWHLHFHSNSLFFSFFFFSLSDGVASIRLHNLKRQSSFNGGILGFISALSSFSLQFLFQLCSKWFHGIKCFQNRAEDAGAL